MTNNTSEKRSLTIEEAAAAIEAKGHKRYTTREGKVLFYDPRKRGSAVTLVGGYRNASFSEFPQVVDEKGKCSGAFHSQMRAIIADLMA